VNERFQPYPIFVKNMSTKRYIVCYTDCLPGDSQEKAEKKQFITPTYASFS
jgi:hypothetical protein